MWYYNEETGNFSVGSIPTKEVMIDEVVTYEEELGWVLIDTRPEPHDDYVFDGSKWIPKIVSKVVPQVVTMRQARLALLQVGLLVTVESAITSGYDDAMKIEWEYATEVRRDWQNLITLANMLGISSNQLDDLFILASTI